MKDLATNPLPVDSNVPKNVFGEFVAAGGCFEKMSVQTAEIETT